jgi:hypothetical protein
MHLAAGAAGRSVELKPIPGQEHSIALPADHEPD